MVRDRRGFTLIELLVFVLIFLGAATGMALGARHGVGVLPCLGLALLGASIGLLSPLVVLVPLSLLDRFEHGPPPCFQGRCTPTDYIWDRTGPRSLCRCRCGDEYELRDDRFLRHFGDGLQLPYMKRDRRGRWQPEVRVRRTT